MANKSDLQIYLPAVQTPPPLLTTQAKWVGGYGVWGLFGTTGGVFTVRMIAEKMRKHGKQCWILLLDGVKASDSVERKMNVKILEKDGAPKEFTNVIAMIYECGDLKTDIDGIEKTINTLALGVRPAVAATGGPRKQHVPLRAIQQAASYYCFIQRPAPPGPACAAPAPGGPGAAPAAPAPYSPLGRLQQRGRGRNN